MFGVVKRMLMHAAAEAIDAADVQVERTEDGGVVLRRGAASVAAIVSRDVPGVGAGFVVMPRTHGVSVSLGIPGFAVSLGASAKRTNWVDWEQWVLKPQNIDGAREVLVWATRTHLFWSFWVRPRPRSNLWRPELRRGSGAWDRLIFGRRRTKRISSVTHPAKVRMAEGDYDAEVIVSVDEVWRARFPAFRRRVSETLVKCDVGIARPDDRNSVGDPSVCHEVLERYFAAATSDPDLAAREMSASITRARLTHGGPFWKPMIRVRRRTANASLFQFPWRLRGQASAGEAPVATPEEWQIRDPMTGQWSAWQKPPGEALPDGVIESSHIEAPMAILALAGALISGTYLATHLAEDA